MTFQSWSDFPVLPERSERRAVSDPAARCLELPESGWGALVAWVAGPARVARGVAGSHDSPVVETVTTAAGTTHRSERARTPTDQAEIDDDADAYLKDAGVPARPRGFRWFLRFPPRCADEDEFWTSLHSALDRDAPEARSPLEIRNAIEGIVEELFRD